VMRKVAGRARLALAQYGELEAFASFGSELDPAAQRQLARGQRTVEVLKQPQYAPMSVEQQVMIIYAVTNGYLDDIPVEKVRTFEAGFHEYMSAHHPEVGAEMSETLDLTEEIEADLVMEIEVYKEVI